MGTYQSAATVEVPSRTGEHSAALQHCSHRSLDRPTGDDRPRLQRHRPVQHQLRPVQLRVLLRREWQHSYDHSYGPSYENTGPTQETASATTKAASTSVSTNISKRSSRARCHSSLSNNGKPPPLIQPIRLLPVLLLLFRAISTSSWHILCQ